MAAMTFAIGGMAVLGRQLHRRVSRAAEFRRAALGKYCSAPSIPSSARSSPSAGLLATLLGGWLGDKLRPRFPSSYFLVSAITILLAFPATVAMLYVPFPAAWGLIFVACFFLFFNTGPANAALANVTPPATRATAFALNILAIHIFGDALSPPLIGWIAGQTNMNLAFLTVSAAMVLASAFWLLGARYLGRDTAAISAGETKDTVFASSS